MTVHAYFCLLNTEPFSVLNFNGYQVESGAIINKFISNFDNSSSSSGDGSDANNNYKELSLTCSALSSDDNVTWMVINSSSNSNYTVNQVIVNNSVSYLTVRIFEGEVTVVCTSQEYNESINVTITTGT